MPPSGEWSGKKPVDMSNYSQEACIAMLYFFYSHKIDADITEAARRELLQLAQRYGLTDLKSEVERMNPCLLYTSDAADEEDSVDLGGRRIIKKKKKRVKITEQ
eukprot:TRINITY_DN20671_c0_g1_i5.p2 TRINITY_DN20671_c0_g1~~TRINITY_DN20671_c0_g1_i5.p2  ORF type:complete len:104 (-),score=29.48 TRINITY_DN20671_c0_g1_i5:67-378(-)